MPLSQIDTKEQKVANCENLVEIFSYSQTKLYDRQNNNPFTGIAECFFPGGFLESRTSYTYGIKDGYQETFHKNGLLSCSQYWTRGKLNGNFACNWENGNIMSKGVARDGNYETIYNYSPSGNLESYFVYDKFGLKIYNCATGILEECVSNR